MPFKELSRVFKKNRKLRRLTRHISKYFVMLTHSAVNVHGNTGANGDPIKAVTEGSIILRFERAANTSQRKSVKSN